MYRKESHLHQSTESINTQIYLICVFHSHIFLEKKWYFAYCIKFEEFNKNIGSVLSTYFIQYPYKNKVRSDTWFFRIKAVNLINAE